MFSFGDASAVVQYTFAVPHVMSGVGEMDTVTVIGVFVWARTLVAASARDKNAWARTIVIQTDVGESIVEGS